MAASTVISNARTGHRTARIAPNGFQGTLALDWANGLLVTAGSTTSISTGVIDASNDRVVFCTTPTTGVYITIAATPTAGSVAGNLFLAPNTAPQPIYVPAGLAIAALSGGVTPATLLVIPALIASDPG